MKCWCVGADLGDFYNYWYVIAESRGKAKTFIQRSIDDDVEFLEFKCTRYPKGDIFADGEMRELVEAELEPLGIEVICWNCNAEYKPTANHSCIGTKE